MTVLASHIARFAALLLLILSAALPLRVAAQEPGSRQPSVTAIDTLADSATSRTRVPRSRPSLDNTVAAIATDTVTLSLPADSLAAKEQKPVFNPDPKRALWLSVLCPGLGQVYNRRYWKIPIVVGAFVGLGYGTSWNNRMLNDYSKAYRDLTDNDPDTRSYMDFFPPTTQESSLDKSWLQKTLKSRKDSYRRYRDLCIIGMAAMYLINVVDAYVDASMLHFDVSPDLSMKIAPAVLNQQATASLPAIGVGCAIAF